MALSLVTGVTVEPITLTVAKAHARIDVDDDDDLVEALIIASRQWCEAFTHRALAPQTWDLKRDEFPCWAIEIPMPPVTAIGSVTYVDTNGDTQTLTATTHYTTDLPAGPMALPARVVPAYGVVWPVTRCVPNAVTVRFTAGYTSSGVNVIPEAIKQAMKLLIGHWYANRESVVVGPGVTASAVPATVETLLWPYKVF